MRSPALTLAFCVLVAQVPQSGAPSGLKATLAADKPAYAPGESITFTLRVVNGTPRPVRLSFRTAQRFDLVMEDGRGHEVWRWSAGRLFAQVLGQETLSPSGGEFVAQATAEGRFPPGSYTAKGTIPAMEGALSASTTVTIR